jgi:hypothetical protein
VEIVNREITDIATLLQIKIRTMNLRGPNMVLEVVVVALPVELNSLLCTEFVSRSCSIQAEETVLI